jgi:uroporphyrinogen-III synthase
LLITRPREEAEDFAAAVRAVGIDPFIEPMLEIRPNSLARPLDLAGVQALLVTSRNGLAALAQATTRRDIPLFAVGDASARAARAAGFISVQSADGDAEALAALVIDNLEPRQGVVLHVAGKAVAGDLTGTLAAAGFAARRAVLYEAVAATALSPGCGAALAAGRLDAAVFFSPRTAATFVRLVQAAALQDKFATMIAFCLSPAAAAAAAALSWGRIAVAERPNQDALLRLLRSEGESR